MSDDIRSLVATASRILAAAGQGDLIWGHASARDPDGHGVWLKSAQWGLEETTPDRVHLVSEDGQVLEGDGQRHSEYPIHTEVMIARPDVGGVVHTHPPHAVALAATGQALRPVSHAANFFVPPEVPRFTGTGDLILSRDLGREVAAGTRVRARVIPGQPRHRHRRPGSADRHGRRCPAGAGLRPADADPRVRRMAHLVRARGVTVQAAQHLPRRLGAGGLGLPGAVARPGPPRSASRSVILPGGPAAPRGGARPGDERASRGLPGAPARAGAGNRANDAGRTGCAG